VWGFQALVGVALVWLVLIAARLSEWLGVLVTIITIIVIRNRENLLPEVATTKPADDPAKTGFSGTENIYDSIGRRMRW
jgi:hypothetical protein